MNTVNRYNDILISLLNDNKKDRILRLLLLAEKIKNQPKSFYHFDFKNCVTISAEEIAVCGGISNYLTTYLQAEELHIRKVAQYLWTQKIIASEEQAKTFIEELSSYKRYGINFVTHTMPASILKILTETDFLSHLKSYSEDYSGNYSGFKISNNEPNEEDLSSYIQNDWLSDQRINISQELKSLISSKISELFVNAYGHGINKFNLPIGIVSCAIYDQENKILTLSIFDFGGGIVERVNSFLKENKHPELDSVDAMNWAFSRHNSTKTDSKADIPRGLGFDLLREFISVNSGEFEVYSNDCYSFVDEAGRYNTSKIDFNFSGTLVTISINCDKCENAYYELVPNYF